MRPKQVAPVYVLLARVGYYNEAVGNAVGVAVGKRAAFFFGKSLGGFAYQKLFAAYPLARGLCVFIARRNRVSAFVVVTIVVSFGVDLFVSAAAEMSVNPLIGGFIVIFGVFGIYNFSAARKQGVNAYFAVRLL